MRLPGRSVYNNNTNKDAKSKNRIIVAWVNAQKPQPSRGGGK